MSRLCILLKIFLIDSLDVDIFKSALIFPLHSFPWTSVLRQHILKCTNYNCLKMRNWCLSTMSLFLSQKKHVTILFFYKKKLFYFLYIQSLLPNRFFLIFTNVLVLCSTKDVSEFLFELAIKNQFDFSRGISVFASEFQPDLIQDLFFQLLKIHS